MITENEIQQMMEVGNVTREYAIELLELEAASQIIFPVVENDEYQNYLNGPLDPRD